MDQQCSAQYNYGRWQIFKLSISGRNSCPWPKLLPINCLINDRLSVRQHATSTYQHLTQHVDRLTPVALPRFCHQQDWSWS